MKLTPIRVRGKRKRPQAPSTTPKPPASHKSQTPQTSSQTSSHNASAKRPRSSSPPSSQAPAKMPRTALRNATTKKNAKKVVPFDRRFPFEIIERIFLLSKNLNLPRASPRLGWLLSGRRTLIEMAILAFSPTWDRFTEDEGGTLDDISIDDNMTRFQTTILTYSWAKVDLLLDAEHLWVQRRRLSEHLRSLNYFSLDAGLVAPLKCVVNPERLPDLIKLHPQPEPSDVEGVIKSASRKSVSVYPCFTFDQLIFMLRCHESYYVDPSAREEPLDLLEKGRSSSDLASVLSVHEINYCLDKATSPFIDHSRGCKHWHVHEGVRIPEWLLLGGGPYVKKKQPRNTREDRDSIRRRLRVAFDTFYWAVQGGARLSHTDSWEVTLQGVNNLLAVDLSPHDDEETQFAATATQELADKRLKDWGASGVRDDMVYLGYSLDSLVMGYLALFGSLGLFTRSWPAKVMEEFMLAVTERAVDDADFRQTRTFQYLQRAALHRWSLGQIHEMMARDPLSMTGLGDARARYLKNAGCIESSASAGAYAGR